MPARDFTRSAGDGLLLAIGGCPASIGPVTVVAICKWASNPAAFGGIVAVGNSDGSAYMMHSDGSSLEFWDGATDHTTAITFGTADGWALVAVTKPAGTVPGTIHKVRLDGSLAPAHTATATNIADRTGVSTFAHLASYLGSIGATTEKFDGDMLIAAVYAAVLSNAQLEAMAFDYRAWWVVQPAALWLLDQDTTAQLVRDQTGGGANQNSQQSSISSLSVPSFTYGHEIRATGITTTITVQHLQASADSVDGTWTNEAAGTTLAVSIDEDTASDSDYIQSVLGPSNAGCRVKIESGSNPQSGDRTFHWRVGKNTTGGGQIDMKVQIRQGGGNSLGGGTLVEEFTRNNVDAATTYDETVTGTVTDYADLYAEFYANQST
jgi:hypothetical protein